MISCSNNIWKKIFFTENQKRRRIIRIFGIKLTFNRVGRALRELDDVIQRHDECNKWRLDCLQNMEYETAHTIWMRFGATKELLARISYLAQSEHQWSIQNNRLWLIYISCLVETNNEEQALDILNKYFDKWGG